MRAPARRNRLAHQPFRLFDLTRQRQPHRSRVEQQHLQQIAKRQVVRTLHKGPANRETGLAAIHRRAEPRGFGGEIEIGVFKHEQRIAAGQFHRRRNQTVAEMGGDAAANVGTAGEDDKIDGGIGQRRSASAGRFHHLH